MRLEIKFSQIQKKLISFLKNLPHFLQEQGSWILLVIFVALIFLDIWIFWQYAQLVQAPNQIEVQLEKINKPLLRQQLERLEEKEQKSREISDWEIEKNPFRAAPTD